MEMYSGSHDIQNMWDLVVWLIGYRIIVTFVVASCDSPWTTKT